MDASHIFAKIGLGVTGTLAASVWLTGIDSILRIILTIVGIVAGIFSARYYRAIYKRDIRDRDD